MKPYEFTGPYERCLTDRRTAMDIRHIYLMHEILASWPFRDVLEIGSYWGASSTAFVEAVNSSERMRAVLCDITPTPNLLRVAGNAKPGRLLVTNSPSTEVLDQPIPFEFIFVDGNHDLNSVRPEINRLLLRRPLCVMAHDTNATAAGYSLADGAQMLAKTFRALPQYHCVEDCRSRPGEETQRGLFLATTNTELFRVAQTAFEKWSN